MRKDPSLCLAHGRCSVNAHSPSSTRGSITLVLHTAWPPSPPSMWVFWRYFAGFGSMHERGGKLSMFLAQVKIPASWLQSALWRDLTKVRSSAWTLQSVTGGDSFPDFLLPHYCLPTIIFYSAFFRKIPHQKAALEI